MYSGAYAKSRAVQPALIMAGTNEIVTHGELEARSNRLAHLLRASGLRRLEHYAIFMENHVRYVETCGAGERSGLYYPCINSYLTADELAYIINNSQSRLLITSQAKLNVALAALPQCSDVARSFVVDGPGDGVHIRNLDEATAGYPDTPIPDESLGIAMLYSSGTTGQPKGILRPMPEQASSQPLPLYDFLHNLWSFRDGLTYLSPAPLYHAAPHLGVNLTIRAGGTAIIMERFDPEGFLRLVQTHRVTHTQLVPTMFSRLLKLPEAVRRGYDLASLEIAIHAAAPCPVQVKQQMIDWWDLIILEYYGITEAMGITACDSEAWLAHKGTVGRPLFGELHILDPDMQPCPVGRTGMVWFRLGSQFEYFNDEARTAQALSPDGTMGTVGDIGHVDADGYLYRTDRSTFMIISGGVNIYPQECEDLLITRPKIADAAVFGVPNADLGEEVKAAIQLMPGIEPSPELVTELLEFCGRHLARHKVPRSIDFEAELPRSPTGKLYKRILRDRYWANQESRIV